MVLEGDGVEEEEDEEEEAGEGEGVLESVDELSEGREGGREERGTSGEMGVWREGMRTNGSSTEGCVFHL